MADGFNTDVANMFQGYRREQNEVLTNNLLASQIDEIQAKTQGEKLKNQQQQQQMDFQQRLQKAMAENQSGQPANTPTDVADQIDDMADMYVKSGFVNDGASLHEKASLIRQREGAAERAQLDAIQKRITIQEKANSRLAAALNGVDSPEAFNKAIDMVDQEMRSAGMKETGLKGRSYSPETVALLRNMATTVQQQQKKSLDELKERDRKLMDASLREQRRKQQAHWDAIDRDRKEAAARKSGQEKAKSSTAPNTNERKAAQSSLLKAYPGLTEGEEASGTHPELAAAVTTIASEAKSKVMQNPALTYERAINQAIFEHRDDFKASGRKTTFMGGGNEPGTALPLPKDAKSLKPADLIKNKYYQLSKSDKIPSGLAIWTGTGFVAVDEEGVEVDSGEEPPAPSKEDMDDE